MKTQTLLLSFAACILVALSNGCNKQETAPPLAASEVAKPVERPSSDAITAAVPAPPAVDDAQAADALKAAEAQKRLAAEADQALKQAAADKLAAEQAAAEKQAQLAAASTRVQGLIDSAKRLSAENKWEEALKFLAQLAGEKLSPAQTAVVDGLKADAQKQAQAAGVAKASTAAEKALGGLLQPKK